MAIPATSDPVNTRDGTAPPLASLGRRALVVYVVLLQSADEDGTVRRPQSALATDTGGDVRSVQRGLQELRAAGLITTEVGVAGATHRLTDRRSIRPSANPTVGQPDRRQMGFPPGPPHPRVLKSFPLVKGSGCISPKGIMILSDGSDDGDMEKVTRGMEDRSPVGTPTPQPPAPVAGVRTPAGNARQTHANAQQGLFGPSPLPTPVPDPEPAKMGVPFALELVPPESVDTVLELFTLWQRVTGHTRSRLDDRRRGILRRALRDYGRDECVAALKGVGMSDWHMGRDPATDGKTYNELDNVFRSAAHVEKFAAMARAPDPVPVVNVDTLTQQWQDLANEFYVARGDPRAHDGEPPAGADRFHPRLRPIGKATVLGEVVPVFANVELVWRALNAAAARYAGKRLRAKHDDHEVAVWLSRRNEQDTAAELRECYAKLLNTVDNNEPDDVTEVEHAHG